MHCGCVQKVSLNIMIMNSRLRRLVLCILHTMIFYEKKNENAGRNDESSLEDICGVISRDYIALFPQR